MSKTTQGSRYGVGSKIAGVFLSAAMLASSFLGVGGVLSVPAIQADAASDYGLADNIQDGNILHCFCWKYTDITSMLPEIAEAGFTSIQVSPPQATSGTGAWWWVYQPKGFYIGSTELGNKEQLKTLCTEADTYGIKIIADIVANHLAGDHSVIQDDLKDSQYWHDYAGNADDGDRYRVTHGKIGMPDLNTEHSYVQQCVYNYVQELKSVGIDGIRFDAAKHIGLPSEGDQFWPNVTKDPDLWYYGEILNNPGLSFDENSGQRAQAISVMKEYSNYIGITDSPYGMTLRNSFNSGTAPSSFGNYCGTWMGLSNSRLVYWGESHDTWSNNQDWGYSNEMSQNVIDRAYAVAASRNGITALYFSRPSSKVKDDIKLGSKGSTHFTSKEVAAVNHFKNAMNGKADYYTVTNNCSVITRKGGGAVIVKGSGSGSVTVTNGGGYVPAGTYTDKVSGNTFTVTSTQITGNVGDSGIAVIYEGSPIVTGASVSATPGTSTFTSSTLSVKLGVTNASSGSYTTSEGKSGTYTNGQSITIGSSTAVGSSVTLTLTATGEDGKQAKQTYTYTKKDPSAVTTIYFDNTSYKWSNVYAYVYDDGNLHFKDTANWGRAYAYFFANNAAVGAAWPGTAMTKGASDYYIAVPSGATHVVFNNGGAGSQTADLPVAGVYGYTASGSTYSSSGSGASTVTQNAAWPGAKMTLDSSTGYYTYEVPTNLVNGRVIFSDGTNSASNRYPANKEPGLSIGDTSMIFKAGNTWEKYTPVVTPDPDPEVPTVTVDKASGSSFTTETYTIKLTLANATTGTYKVDGGPVKSFTGTATVTIGEGKIGDSTVTVETTATSGSTTKSYTFTYNKKYEVKTSSSSASALTGKYATNPNGQKGGAGVTITSPSDFKENMIIAQGVANDDPRIFRGSHEAPVYDSYALYGAWDDKNIYLGWQFTNVTDVVDPAQGYPMSDNGKPWNGDIPQMLAFDLGKGQSADMSAGNMAGGKYVWGIKVGYTTRVDALMCFSSKPGVGVPALFKTDSTGYFNYDDAYVTGFKAGGISFKYEDGFFGSKITGIKSNGYSGYTPADLTSSSAAWVDFLQEGHSKAQDTFYYMTIPFSALGITRSYLESNGIGVMHISTFGEGGIGSCPMDMTMLDAATEPYGPDESSSHEKDDTDVISVPLARLGAGSATGGDDPIIITPDPDPETTPLQVNFGTDKSAPQLTTTALTIKGIGIGGTAPYKYEFSVDNKVVKASNTTATYTWTPGTTGKHTMKCVITDSTGATATVTKTFTAEGESVVTPDPNLPVNESTISSTKVEAYQPVTITGAASGGKAPYKYWFSYKKSTDSEYTIVGEQYGSTKSATFYPAVAGTYNVVVRVKDANNKVAKMSYTVKASSSTSTLKSQSTINQTSIKVGTAIKLTAKATGGSGSYTYAFYFKRSSNTLWKTLGTEFGTTTTAKVTPTSDGYYDFRVLVKDGTGRAVTKTFKVTVKKNTDVVNNSTISATSVKTNKAVTITGKAAGGTSPYQYAYFYKKSTTSSWTTIKSYSTTTSASFTPTAAGTYNVKVSVKDSAGKIATKQFTVTVT